MDPNTWFQNAVNPEDVEDRTLDQIMFDRADMSVPVQRFMGDPMSANVTDQRKTYDTTVMSLKRTGMSDLFFQSENIDRIKLTLKELIWQDTGYRIGNQPEAELVQAMQYVYDTYYPTIPNTDTCKPNEGITFLNQRLYDFLVPIMKGNLRSHLDYLKNLESQPAKSTSLRPESTRVFRSDKK